jgi:uncharacterized protein (DUF302 family)
MSSELGGEIHLPLPFPQAVERVQVALKAEGFGILSTIDVQAAFRDKLGVHFRPYTILGACNPPLAHKALTASAEVGLMLPCNVTVEEESPGHSVVRVVRPSAILGANPDAHPAAVREVAADAEARLARVTASLR